MSETETRERDAKIKSLTEKLTATKVDLAAARAEVARLREAMTSLAEQWGKTGSALSRVTSEADRHGGKAFLVCAEALQLVLAPVEPSVDAEPIEPSGEAESDTVKAPTAAVDDVLRAARVREDPEDPDFTLPWNRDEEGEVSGGQTDGESDVPCLLCGRRNGRHGVVHVRHGNGGGHNEPCPLLAARPVLSREALRAKLDEHWPSWTSGYPLTVECKCDWQASIDCSRPWTDIPHRERQAAAVVARCQGLTVAQQAELVGRRLAKRRREGRES